MIAQPDGSGATSGNGTYCTWLVGGLVVVGVLLGLLLLSRARRHESPVRAACKNNLRQIGIALQLYAAESDGLFPTTLLPLYPQYTDNLKIFVCPDSPASHEDFRAGRITERSSSYTYVPGLSAVMPKDFIAAYDKSLKNHGKRGLNVLCIDGTVSWQRADDQAALQRRLVLQAEAVEKWRASGKPAKDIDEFISPELQRMMSEDEAKGVSDAGR